MSTLKNTTTTGVLIVLLAAIFISLSNVLAPIIYDAGGNPLTYLTLRFFRFFDYMSTVVLMSEQAYFFANAK